MCVFCLDRSIIPSILLLTLLLGTLPLHAQESPETPAAPEAAPAPEPDAGPRPQPGPRPAAPAPAPGVPAQAPEGMADTVPAFERLSLPGLSRLESGVATYPHIKDGADATSEPAQTEAAAEESAPEAEDTGKGFFRGLLDGFAENKTLRNGLLLALLIVIFIVYRLRSGRKGYL